MLLVTSGEGIAGCPGWESWLSVSGDSGVSAPKCDLSSQKGMERMQGTESCTGCAFLQVPAWRGGDFCKAGEG